MHPNDAPPPPDTPELWQWLLWGYLLTIALETPVLWFGLSSRHSWPRRLFAGVWLTACTYPVVALLLPLTVWPWWGYIAYLVVAETFAPLAECILFALAFPTASSNPDEREIAPGGTFRDGLVRDCAAIVAANLTSFLVGGWLFEMFRSQ